MIKPATVDVVQRCKAICNAGEVPPIADVERLIALIRQQSETLKKVAVKLAERSRHD